MQELLKLADELSEHGKLFFHAPTKREEINGTVEPLEHRFEGKGRNKNKKKRRIWGLTSHHLRLSLS